jgi:hypothetical protein
LELGEPPGSPRPLPPVRFADERFALGRPRSRALVSRKSNPARLRGMRTLVREGSGLLIPPARGFQTLRADAVGYPVGA